MFKFKSQSSKTYRLVLEMQISFKDGKTYEKSKPATDLRGLRLIHDNAGAHKCKLVQDFLDTETIHPNHQTLVPVTYSTDLLKNNMYTVIFQCQQGYPKSLLICTQSPDFKT